MDCRCFRLLFFIFVTISHTSAEDGYLRYVKDGCYVENKALSCLKYKALKVAERTFFENSGNFTIQPTNYLSFVTLEDEHIKNLTVYNPEDTYLFNEPRGLVSEWTSLTSYLMKLVKDFFRMKGLRVDLPDGARTVEDAGEDARGKRKKLAIIIPFLALLAALKTKLLLIPVLLGVLFIKKLLLAAALLLPGLLSTLKHCKHHQHQPPSYSYFGSDASEYNSDYSSGSNYGYSNFPPKDWASSRAYSIPKHRATPPPVMYTAPGSIA